MNVSISSCFLVSASNLRNTSLFKLGKICATHVWMHDLRGQPPLPCVHDCIALWACGTPRFCNGGACVCRLTRSTGGGADAVPAKARFVSVRWPCVDPKYVFNTKATCQDNAQHFRHGSSPHKRCGRNLTKLIQLRHHIVSEIRT